MTAACVYALFVWWFSTGVVLLLDNLPRRTFRYSMVAGTVVFVLALHRLSASSDDVSEAGAWAAFTYAVLAWAWQEMSFFMGYVTGPRLDPAPPGCTTWERFKAGIMACLWHELAIIGTAIVIAAITWGGANQVGTWTFMLLWLMRTSAKLNVFLGVLNLGEEFLPAHLRYLLSFMARRRMNALMPFSLAGGTIGAVMLAQAASDAATAATAAGLAMLATMTALAVVEHWCLILPLPFARLWGWSLKYKPGKLKQSGREQGIRDSRRTSHGLPAVLP